MEQPAEALSSCRLNQPAGDCLPGEELCGFEFAWCEGCPKSLARNARALEDPMQSVIWRSWIDGLAAARK